MSKQIIRPTGERLRTPKSAAVAGIVFALLLIASYVLIRISIPADTGADVQWLDTRRRAVTIGLALVPFAGIAFLWFIGVVRDRIGEYEDRFFSTVFFGSGLLFLAMTFAAAALGGGMVATYAAQPVGMVESGLYTFSRDTMYRITNIYAIRMSAVFMMSLGTIWTRTRTMPRWLTLGTYLLAVGLMISISLSLWVALIFPVWVMIISVHILVNSIRGVDLDLPELT
jgi:hypothetical protein